MPGSARRAQRIEVVAAAWKEIESPFEVLLGDETHGQITSETMVS